jgi:hypothetical protein
METNLGGDAVSADANAAFLYRTLAATEAFLLAGAPPQEKGRIAAAAHLHEWACPAIVLPFDGKAAFDEILAIAHEMAGAGGKYPTLILPAVEGACEEAREFAFVYDFTAQRRSAAVLTKPAKLKDAPGVAVGDATPEAELLAAASSELAAQCYCAQDWWAGALASGAVKPLTAQLAGKQAGMLTAVNHGIEYRMCALFTALALRGQGVGRTMMLRFISDAVASGAPLVTAVCAAGGTFGYYLERFGFAQALEYDVFTPPHGFRAPK